MKKIIISKLFLYRHRFIIGYLLLGLFFVSILFTFPLFTQDGLSETEITSATTSAELTLQTIFQGNLVDLPFHFLQKLSIKIFGLTIYAIKLPSILIGLALGLLFTLLLNRWFKSNVSLLTSCLIVLSTPFLFLAGSGTPLIMLVFWPTFLLWLGSKIQGEKHPEPSYCIIFAIALFLALFTPYMIYFAIFCILFVIFQPHLRFIIKNLPKLSLIFTGLIIVINLLIFIIHISLNPSTLLELLFTPNFNLHLFFTNLIDGFRPVFSWRNSSENIFLSPLISLPTFALALIGLFSTTKGFFASRNSIASLLIIFAIIITGFNPRAIIFLILPLSILTAHGIKYLLEKWYGLFPENPYARISAIFPLFILFSIIIFSGLSQYVYGYRYNPNVANEFNNHLSLIHQHLNNETLVVSEHFNFYQLLSDSTSIQVVAQPTTSKTLAFFKKPLILPPDYQLIRIITSEKSDNSDIIYIYTREGE